MGELKKKTLNGVVWKTMQTVSTTGIQFIFTIFMTRLLAPEDYGMVGMLAVFMAISNAFIDCGFGQALIRKQDRTHVDESTVFYFNLVASTLCYAILFAIAPLVAHFYKMPQLSLILRILGLTLVIRALSTIHTLIYTINLDFKTPSIINLSCNVVSGFFGLYLAYRGYEVWALVFQTLFASLLVSITFITVSKWRPLWAFSWKSFKDMFAFGSNLLGATLLNSIYHNLSSIFIGRAYTAADLGIYTKGEKMASFVPETIYGSIESVSYPVLCRFQNDKENLAIVYRKFIRIISFILFPIMTILCLLSTPFLVFLFGERWAESGLYMALMCFPWMLVPIQCLNLNILKVVGRSNLIFRLGLVKIFLGVVMLLITLPISIKAMCIGTIINVCIAFFINAHYTSRFVGIQIKHQLIDMARSFSLSIIVGVVVYFAISFFDGNLAKLCVGGIAGVATYMLLAFTIKMNELKEVIELLKGR